MQIEFVSMPFATLSAPSLGLSLLSKIATDAEVTNSINYFSFAFADRVGVDFYERIASGYPASQDLAGEWIFSASLSNECLALDLQYASEIINGGNPYHSKAHLNTPVSEHFIEQLSAARNAVPDFIEECADNLVKKQPKVVAFTSVFQQHTASLALAKSLKEKDPTIEVVFGGANCELPMGLALMRAYEFVDIVVSGQGERAFSALLKHWKHGETLKSLPELLTRRRNPNALIGAEIDCGRPQAVIAMHRKTPSLEAPLITQRSSPSRPPVFPSQVALDDIPYPNFEDYFKFLEAWKNPEKSKVQPRILIETSRGCWWGEKHHCTFCGLNGADMKFRSKSPERALDEIRYLRKKYPYIPMSVVDNILDMEYFKTLILSLENEPDGLELFYEVKANLQKKHLISLVRAGIKVIQPGIESFGDQILSLMQKGIKGIQNVQLLKWCQELGIRPEWNILYGFPGEPEHEYETMNDLFDAIHHLTPPSGIGRIRMDRFSPNFEQYERFGFSNVSPFPSYKYIYRKPESIINDLAYYFSFDYNRPPLNDVSTGRLLSAVEQWRHVHNESALFYVEMNGGLLVCDLRRCTSFPFKLFKGLKRFCLTYCDSITSCSQILAAANAEGFQCDMPALRDCLQELVEARLLVEDDSKFLTIVLNGSVYQPSATVLRSLVDRAAELGMVNANGERVIVPADAVAA